MSDFFQCSIFVMSSLGELIKGNHKLSDFQLSWRISEELFKSIFKTVGYALTTKFVDFCECQILGEYMPVTKSDLIIRLNDLY